MTEQYNKLLKILREMFQLDQADLDFGIYRIMNQKREEIEKFLGKDLLPQVESEFEKYKFSTSENIAKEIEIIEKESKSLGFDSPLKVPKFKSRYESLKQKLANDSNIDTMSNDVFSHLTNFFNRYYQEGDFIYQRRYKNGVYAIPYEGEEVKLHWANYDQYYIKTSEYFKDYTFRLPKVDKKVHFKIIEANVEQDNKKATQDKERRFMLNKDNPYNEINGELFINFVYEPAPNNQTINNQNTFEFFFKLFSKDKLFENFYTLFEKMPTEKNPNRTVFEKYLNDYTARNTFDYFIHKDLGGFLRRELDFYIKNEVMFIDDLDTENEIKTESYLSKIKVIKRIGHKIIAFLEQLENFQKKLWLKKKFIVEINYCITLDKIPEKYYSEIIKNKEQHNEWIKLFAIDEIKGDMFAAEYSNPLTIEFLKSNPFLVLDTKFFDTDFKHNFIAEIQNLDDNVDGILINSENFQALNLLQARYREQVKCVYIDPPYNTGNDGFVYKDNFQHSSWNSMIYDRVKLAYNLLSDIGIKFTSISDFEAVSLRYLFDIIFNYENYIGTIEWNSTKSVTNTALISVGHTHNYVYAKNIEYYVKNRNHFRLPDDENGFSNPDNDPRGKWKADPFQVGGIRPNQQYTIINPKTQKEYKPNPGCSWKNDYKKYLELLKDDRIIFGVSGEAGPQRKRFWSEASERGKVAKTWWDDVDTTTNGTQQIKEIFNLINFTNPKPVLFLKKIIQLGMFSHKQTILDYFAGSGTTGHAVINLNREDEGNRKYILVEMGDYFETVLKPRIQKVIYSKDWKEGKPVLRDGISHIFKYFKLESYEDTLNNLELNQSVKQKQELFENNNLHEDYILNYMLSLETKDSSSLLNIDLLKSPFDYSLKVKKGNETVSTKIDLIETFNYLLGLKIISNGKIEYFNIESNKKSKTPDAVVLKPANKNKFDYMFKEIEGVTLDDKKILVIWRNLTDDIIKDNAALDAYFSKRNYNTLDFEFAQIYVNGDNNLENLKIDEMQWKVVLIEEEFKKRMFEITE